MRTETIRSPLRAPRGVAGAALAVAIAALLGGCRQDMHNQPKAKPFRASRFFADGESMRQPVPGTVARGRGLERDPAFLREDDLFYTAFTPDEELVAELPVALTPELLLRGRQRFDIYCSPCHDRTGSGNGMIVQRGFKQPQTFHSERLRTERIGYFYDVISNGFGQMSSYGAQVAPVDRWAIAAYIRALQLSQYTPGEVLSSADRSQLAAAASGGAAAAAAAQPAHGAPHE